MAEMKLAYTSAGVESVALIYQDALDSLANWLCADKSYHDQIEFMREHRTTDRAFDVQVKENGGYCHICKDFAGELLSHFELVPKVQP